MRIGVVSTPVPGHLNPMLALAGELQARGHQVIFFHEADVRSSVEQANISFHEIGRTDCGPGHLTASKARLAGLSGLAALRFTIKAVRGTTEMLCRDLPQAVRSEGIDLLIVDQMEPAGGSVAEFLGIPFVTVANALVINREPGIPPPFAPWAYTRGPFATVRNRSGYLVADFLTRSVTRTLAAYRKAWRLPPLRNADDSFSPLAQISQMPAEFDFPRKRLPSCFHYVGPLRRGAPYKNVFPFEKLDGRPLIYASLGTLQGSRFDLFRMIAEACAELDAQLVLAHGGGLTEEQAQALSRHAVVVPFAPQVELLSKARLTITHAGLNTVLDSLSQGVPLITMPITFEQPAIAQRVRFCGAGEMLPAAQATSKLLRRLVESVIMEEKYRVSAARLSRSIQEAGGVARAAQIVESAAASFRSFTLDQQRLQSSA